MTTGLQGEWLNHYATEASPLIMSRLIWIYSVCKFSCCCVWQKVDPDQSLMYFYTVCISNYSNDKVILFKHEPRHEKTCLLGFPPGPTQTGLYSHERWLEVFAQDSICAADLHIYLHMQNSGFLRTWLAL